MAYRNKTYVCFDADTDILHYRLMCAWKENEKIAFDFRNAHDLNVLRKDSSEETIKRKLRERLAGTMVFVVLVGENTKYLYKFVKWEIEYAVEKDIPIIVVNLNKQRSKDADLCPPIIRDHLAIHVSYHQSIIDHALNNWPSEHAAHRKAKEGGPYHYAAQIYDGLGIK